MDRGLWLHLRFRQGKRFLSLFENRVTTTYTACVCQPNLVTTTHGRCRLEMNFGVVVCSCKLQAPKTMIVLVGVTHFSSLPNLERVKRSGRTEVIRVAY